MRSCKKSDNRVRTQLVSMCSLGTNTICLQIQICVNVFLSIRIYTYIYTIGLTIVNIPEQAEPDISPDTKKKTMDGTQSTAKDTSSSSIAAQNVLNEMFSCLTPQRRTLKNGLESNTLSVCARSISPEPRRPQASPANQPESRDLRLGPSPTPVQSRPASARRSNKENIPPSNFSVKHFSHFCFDDDVCMTISPVDHLDH